MTPKIELDDYSKKQLKEATSLEEFSWHWFNGQWPDLMGECIKAYNAINYDKFEGREL